ncbi:MAG TPA: cytochrome c [Desulfomonilia bacterium]|nr:cytochrome c [Desulfomonilia bacterium]
MLALLGTLAAAEKDNKGKDLYNNNCKTCHGTNGEGKGPAASALNPKPILSSRISVRTTLIKR